MGHSFSHLLPTDVRTIELNLGDCVTILFKIVSGRLACLHFGAILLEYVIRLLTVRRRSRVISHCFIVMDRADIV